MIKVVSELPFALPEKQIVRHRWSLLYAPIHSVSQESNFLQHNLIADILTHDEMKGVELKEMATGIFIGTPLLLLVVLD